MEQTLLGRTGLKVSVAGLGCGGHSRLGMFTKGIDNACRVIRQACDSGVNFIDTAYVYGTQPAVGKAMECVSRASYILSTKIPYQSDGKVKPAGEVEKMVDECLRELKTDYIDVLHLHGVRAEHYPQVRDSLYPELLKLKEKGKIRFPGITEQFGTDTTHRMMELALADDLWDVVMIGYNLLNPSAAERLLPVTRAKNVGTLCMFAVRSSLSDPAGLRSDVEKILASGQADPSLVQPDGTLDFLLKEDAARTIMDAAYRFCRHTAGIDVTLTGTGSVDHLAENLASLSAPALPAPILERLHVMFGRVDCVSGQQDPPA